MCLVVPKEPFMVPGPSRASEVFSGGRGAGGARSGALGAAHMLSTHFQGRVDAPAKIAFRRCVVASTEHPSRALRAAEI